MTDLLKGSHHIGVAIALFFGAFLTLYQFEKVRVKADWPTAEECAVGSLCLATGVALCGGAVISLFRYWGF